MKYNILFLLFLLLSLSVIAQHRSELVIMTYNLRYDNNWDSINAWDNRKERLSDQIILQKPDILDVQEALISQMNYLSSRLAGFKHVGVGRDDGIEKGEFSAIFYNNKKYELLDQGNFWLSETPEVPGSMGWDAACTRICSWAKLKDRKQKNIFFVFNTHWDHIGIKARTNSASLIAARIQKIAGTQDVILSGDFNCTLESQELKELLKEKPVLTSVRAKCKAEGPDYSYTGFKVGGSVKPELIDYIFVAEKIKVSSCRFLDDSYQGNYLSDHLPLVAHLSFP
ncbi:MAG: endonuclease/exonuclease/phosphatase family protein [Bacteroidota bacterium]